MKKLLFDQDRREREMLKALGRMTNKEAKKEREERRKEQNRKSVRKEKKKRNKEKLDGFREEARGVYQKEKAAKEQHEIEFEDVTVTITE
ncbi:MAG: uncharacterized protein A8A55_0056 [Amphiamblys sp. WSBS2006]|nr:MAG: uncharacterized protein A8A55_0056 [Amphiamblys sp. WSBS2006]